MQPEGTQGRRKANTTATNATTKPNIVLVHSGRADWGSWSKVIPALTNAEQDAFSLVVS